MYIVPVYRPHCQLCFKGSVHVDIKCIVIIIITIIIIIIIIINIIDIVIIIRKTKASIMGAVLEEVKRQKGAAVKSSICKCTTHLRRPYYLLNI